MENYYEKNIIDDDTIILKKCKIDYDKYNVSQDNDGNIILKKKKIIILENDNLLSNYDYMFSKILYCKINNEKLDNNKLKYNNILKNIYSIIGDGTKIIKNSTLNIKTTVEIKKGFEYLENLGISYQGIDSNKCINEIIKQSVRNNISIIIKIKLKNDNILKLIF